MKNSDKRGTRKIFIIIPAPLRYPKCESITGIVPACAESDTPTVSVTFRGNFLNGRTMFFDKNMIEVTAVKES